MYGEQWMIAGIIMMAAAVCIAVVSMIGFYMIKKKIQKQLELEYGKLE